MELSGQQIVAAPRHAVWNALNDPHTLMQCIPGCEDIEKVSDEETRVRVALKLGPVRARFVGKLVMSDVTPAARCTLAFEGVGGPAGFAKGSSRVELLDQGENTRLTYSVEASVGGKLGQIGGRLIDSSAKKMADDFFASLNRQLNGEAAAANTAASDVVIPSQKAAQSTPAREHEEHVVRTPPEARGVWSGGLQAEFYRVGWFALGVGVTLLLKHIS
jgi:carbon monoxide dehydrogenase subunit G